ncbi:MAG: DUF2383 domain-containing protein, partial [Phycisphaerales bacterium]|nr:DUF2383 domain-containing protein [Phycisphaerales bacterium]
MMDLPHGYRTDYRAEGHLPETIGAEGSIRQLNSLLRGEISAEEAYRLVIEKAGCVGEAAENNLGMLRGVREDHGRAAEALRERIRELGGEASDSSGPWGVWTKLTQKSADLFGDVSALRNLKEGENFGLKSYQDVAEDVDGTTADLIQNQLIPSQQRHIKLLKLTVFADADDLHDQTKTAYPDGSTALAKRFATKGEAACSGS